MTGDGSGAEHDVTAGEPDLAAREGDLAAGDFSSWITEMRGAIRGERGSDVPCDGCTGCCRSSQFVHIAPDETGPLSRIPAELLFPAPGLPSGHVVMGYDEQGCCPMLIDDRCSIYEDRPVTCRTYDCRIFVAAALEIDERDKARIARQVRRWKFSDPTPADTAEHDAVRAAASFLGEHVDLLPDTAVPANVTERAVSAIEIHDVFLRRDEQTGQAAVVTPDPEEVRVALTRRVRPNC